MKKIITIIIVISFFLGNLTFAQEVYFEKTAKTNTYLAPPLALDDITDGTPHKKNVGLLLDEMGLQMDLQKLNSITQIDNTTDAELIKEVFLKEERLYPKETQYKPAIIAYFNMLENVDSLNKSHVFVVPVSIRKDGNRYNYRLLFSTIRKDGIFPVVFCTEEKLEKIRAELVARDSLPVMAKSGQDEINGSKDNIFNTTRGRDVATVWSVVINSSIIQAAFVSEGYITPEIYRKGHAEVAKMLNLPEVPDGADLLIIQDLNKLVAEGILNKAFKQGGTIRYTLSLDGQNLMTSMRKMINDVKFFMTDDASIAKQIQDRAMLLQLGYHPQEQKEKLRSLLNHSLNVFNQVMIRHALLVAGDDGQVWHLKRMLRKLERDDYKTEARIRTALFEHGSDPDKQVSMLRQLAFNAKNAEDYETEGPILLALFRAGYRTHRERLSELGNILLARKLPVGEEIQEELLLDMQIKTTKKKTFFPGPKLTEENSGTETIKFSSILAERQSNTEGPKTIKFLPLLQKTEENAGKTVLIVGGAGYIGSTTAERFNQAIEGYIEDGYKIIVYDNLSAGHVKALPQGVELIKGELSDKEALKNVMIRSSVSEVVHFAAFIESGESVRIPSKYIENNVINTLILLEAMREAGIKDLVFSSSAAVYGTPEGVPISESAKLVPTSPYGESKLLMEYLMREYAQKYGFRIVALRYFNAAGALSENCGEDHDPETHIIPRFVKAVLNDEDINIFGDGKHRRDYVHVKDLAKAHRLAVNWLAKQPRDKGIFEAFNLGTGKMYTNLEVAQMVIKLVKDMTGKEYKGKIKHMPERAGDPRDLQASSEKAKEILGWIPEHSELEEIIRDAVQWHVDNPEGFAENNEKAATKPEIERIRNIISLLRDNKTVSIKLKMEILERLFRDEIQKIRVIDVSQSKKSDDEILQWAEESNPEQDSIYNTLGKEIGRYRTTSEVRSMVERAANPLLNSLISELKIEEILSVGSSARARKQLATHVYNALEGKRICTIGQLLEHAREDLLLVRGLGVSTVDAIDKALKSHGFELRTKERDKLDIYKTVNMVVGELLNEVLSLIDKTAYNDIGVDYASVAEILEEAGGGETLYLREKDILIFSKKVTFDDGLGALLPHLAQCGIKIAVITADERQEELIVAINGKMKNKKNNIEYARSIVDIKALCPGTTKFYYVKTKEETVPDNDPRIIPITVIAVKIIEALGKVCGVTVDDLKRLSDAAQAFNRAA